MRRWDVLRSPAGSRIREAHQGAKMNRSFAGAARAVLIAGAVTGAALASGDARPQYGSWGFDANGVDAHTKPGDDFFRYANGTWLDKTPIPEDKPGYSLRLAMTDRTEGRLHDLMEAASKSAGHEPATLDGKVGAFY